MWNLFKAQTMISTHITHQISSTVRFLVTKYQVCGLNVQMSTTNDYSEELDDEVYIHKLYDGCLPREILAGKVKDVANIVWNGRTSQSGSSYWGRSSCMLTHHE